MIDTDEVQFYDMAYNVYCAQIQANHDLNNLEKFHKGVTDNERISSVYPYSIGDILSALETKALIDIASLYDKWNDTYSIKNLVDKASKQYNIQIVYQDSNVKYIQDFVDKLSDCETDSYVNSIIQELNNLLSIQMIENSIQDLITVRNKKLVHNVIGSTPVNKNMKQARENHDIENTVQVDQWLDNWKEDYKNLYSIIDIAFYLSKIILYMCDGQRRHVVDSTDIHLMINDLDDYIEKQEIKQDGADRE